jgi:integrase
VLDATGMRVGELEALTWGDVDEPKGRWRVSAAVSKSGKARWVSAPAAVFGAVTRLVAREDRADTRPVFQGFGADRFRTALARACRTAGVPTFSPHDSGTGGSRCCTSRESRGRGSEAVGHGDIVTTARTYTHVIGDAEVDYEEVLA